MQISKIQTAKYFSLTMLARLLRLAQDNKPHFSASFILKSLQIFIHLEAMVARISNHNMTVIG